MIIFDYLGQPLQHQKIVPGNTATQFSKYCYNYKRWRLNYDSGGTTEITANCWIKGATSSALAKVVSVTLSSGTWAGGNAAGYLILDSWNGTAFQDNEKITFKAVADDGDVDGVILDVERGYDNEGLQAKAALVSVYANTELVAFDGSVPDQTQLIGQPMAAASSIILQDINQIKNFYCIDYTAASAGIVQATFFF